MKTFTIECVTLKEVCELNKLDIEAVLEAICDSFISFGENADTLLTRSDLEGILLLTKPHLDGILKHKLDWVWGDNVLISLGC